VPCAADQFRVMRQASRSVRVLGTWAWEVVAAGAHFTLARNGREAPRHRPGKAVDEQQAGKAGRRKAGEKSVRWATTFRETKSGPDSIRPGAIGAGCGLCCHSLAWMRRFWGEPPGPQAALCRAAQKAKKRSKSELVIHVAFNKSS